MGWAKQTQLPILVGWLGFRQKKRHKLLGSREGDRAKRRYRLFDKTMETGKAKTFTDHEKANDF